MTFITCLPLRVLATTSSSGTTKPLPSWEASSSLRFGIVDEGGHDVLVVLHVDDDADRLAMAAAARQPVGADRVELAAGREDQHLVGRLRMEGELQAVALLEGEQRQVGRDGLSSRAASPFPRRRR